MKGKMKKFTFGEIVIGVAADIGPRVLHLAHAKKPDLNLFGVLPDAGVKTEEGFWHIYGGHRLWTAPEASPRSYSPENKPVRIEKTKTGLKILGNPEPANATQKEIRIEPVSKYRLAVTHRITNIGRWPVTMACWALSVMKKGGFAVLPLKPAGQGLLPDRRLNLWPYTDLSDARLKFYRDCAILNQDPAAKGPIKIGAMAVPAWTAYCVDGLVFVKTFTARAAEYPDFGCSVEIYTNPDFLELETVGPLENVAPGGTIEHTEYWSVAQTPDLRPTSPSIRKLLDPLT